MRVRTYRQLTIAVLAGTLMTAAALRSSSAQEKFTHGQTIAPAYEGFIENPDGTFDLVFGYLNRNYEESLDVPIGPENNLEPGGPDQGQPTHFLTRRRRHQFSIKVPKDFGNKEVVWTLTSRGKTEKAYGTLKPDYILDNRVMMMNNSSFGQRGNEGDNLAAGRQDRGRSTAHHQGGRARDVGRDRHRRRPAGAAGNCRPASSGRRRQCEEKGIRTAGVVVRVQARRQRHVRLGTARSALSGWTHPAAAPTRWAVVCEGHLWRARNVCAADHRRRHGASHDPGRHRHRRSLTEPQNTFYPGVFTRIFRSFRLQVMYSVL